MNDRVLSKWLERTSGDRVNALTLRRTFPFRAPPLYLVPRVFLLVVLF